MNVYVCDIETESLNATKIHVISYRRLPEGKTKSITDYDTMRKFLSQPDLVMIMHNGIRFDLPTLKRLLGININAFIVDTLALSWYLFPKRNKHGLEEWGEDVGIPKVKIEDWENLPIERYIERCETDVDINSRVWAIFETYLKELYDVEDILPHPFLKYLMFKMDIAQMQEEEGWDVNLDRVREGLSVLSPIKEEKKRLLEGAMPPVTKYKIVEAPQKPYKKDGSLSVQGAKWQHLLKEGGLPDHYRGSVRVVDRVDPPNANSPEQVKEWLFSLGWEPTTFKETKSKATGIVKSVPQIKKLKEDDLCESVKRLIEDHSEVAYLEGLSIVSHRIGILEGFLRDQKNGKLVARIQGFTNTLRFKHTEIVNLPKVDAAYGEYIRCCLVAPKGKLLCGTDMVAIENKTGDHYMSFYDPQYVKDKNTPDYDSHTDMAVIADLITREEEEFYKWYKSKK